MRRSHFTLLSALFVATLALPGCTNSDTTAPDLAALTISTTSLPNGQVGIAYSATLNASGGTTPYSWSLASGTLPSGLSLNASTGVVRGTPTVTASATSLTFAVTDSSSPAQTKSITVSLTISAGVSPLTIVTTSLPNGQVGAPYSATLTATGGTAPYVWSLTDGSFPTGISLNVNTGAITGTPTQAVSSAGLSLKVTDSGSPTQSQSVNLAITILASSSGSPLSITTASLPNGQVGIAYSATLTASGGTTPYSWSLTGGTLPSGLSLNASTGIVSGTPTATASATSLTFAVTDSSGPAQTKSVTVSLIISAGVSPLTIVSTSLPSGQVGIAYSATLNASGGTTPYSWSLTGGTLPSGLSLNASTGIVSGTPTATASATPLTFAVTDSSNPAQTKSVALSLTLYASSGISVSISLQNTGITIAQTLSVSATTTDHAGVTWLAAGSNCTGSSCGTFSPSASLSGVPVTYTPPSAAGLYTLTASSVTNQSITASATVGVTDLAGVTTYHNDPARDGSNTQEYALNPSDVTSSTFGKLFSCAVDESIYAQPLWVPNLVISSTQHNVVFVATQNDSVYAFDADTNTSPCTPLWHANLLDTAHGANNGENAVLSGLAGYLVGQGGGDIQPLVGVTGTPVIDLTTNTLYVVSKSVDASGTTFFQRLHALDLTTGNERFSGPVNISATFPGNGDGTSTTTFVPQQENQRPGLALINGVVYVAWASHEDTTPFYGWIIGYDASSLTQSYVFNVDPNTPSSPIIGTAGDGGIWMSGGAPAADASGNLYVLTANGSFDPTTSDYGDSFMEFNPPLTVNQYFTPSDQQSDNDYDIDFGSGGAAVLIDLPANGSNPTHLVVGGGKDNALYVLNRDNMGGYGDSNAWQRVAALNGEGLFATGAFWNDTYYIAPYAGPLQALALDPSTAQLTLLPSTSPTSYSFPGATPSVSSMPNTANGIVWAIDSSQYCTPQSPGCGPAILHAYDATNLSNELWNSNQGSGNSAGNAVKFTVPTIANGKVYVGTRGNNTGGLDNTTSVPGELDVYGLVN